MSQPQIRSSRAAAKGYEATREAAMAAFAKSWQGKVRGQKIPPARGKMTMRLTVSAALLSLLGCNAVFAQEHKTYRCTVADEVRLTDEGRLRPRFSDNRKSLMRLTYDGVLIDTFTGAITLATGKREVWKIIQRGDATNDYILAPASDLDVRNGRVAKIATTDFVRLRAWGRQAKFLAFGLDELVAGPCEANHPGQRPEN